MAKQPVTIAFDPDLLEALRAEEPGKPDRELLSGIVGTDPARPRAWSTRSSTGTSSRSSARDSCVRSDAA